MTIQPTELVFALTGLAAVALIAFTGLRGFIAWLELKHAELKALTPAGAPSTSGRIELADLKERLRKLEAIAAGVDL